MRIVIAGSAVLCLFGIVACGSSGGTTIDADAVVADVPVADLPAEDDGVQADMPIADVPVTTDADTPPAGFEWDASPTPNCVGAFCAAGPDSAPDPMAPGPFPVGVRRVVLVDPNQTNFDGTPRTLVTEIWYPTTKEFYDSHPTFAYDIKADVALAPGYENVLGMIGDVDVGGFTVPAVKDAPVRHGDGRYPLVMFSHGAFGIRYQSIFYTVALASHGYVVVAPDHEKNTLYDLIQNGYQSDHLGESAWARPLDILYLMDQMTTWDKDPTNEFYKTIETDNVGITGHSFGGYTCFATAFHPDANGYPDFDPRIKAIVPHSPAGYLIGATGAYGPDWHLPTTIMGGEMDNTLEYQQAFKTPWDDLGGPKWFLDIKRGGHFTFSDLCRLNLLEVADKLGYEDAKNALTDGCGVENWDYKEANKAINLYSIATFNRFLRHSTGSAQFMTQAAGAQFGDEVIFLSAE
jgi:predicted dienelactone hydrolase